VSSLLNGALDEGASLVFFFLSLSPLMSRIPDKLVDLGFEGAVASGNKQT